MSHSDKYMIIAETVIDDTRYGYVKTFQGQAFYAIADGWEVICGVSHGKVSKGWILVKRPYIKKESAKDRFELMDL